MSSRRRQQVGDLIRDEVSQILTYEMKDPRLGMISITRVEMSPDLRYATIHASVYGDDETTSETFQVLTGATGYIRRLLAPRLRIRHIPVLSFRMDHSMAHADEIARTLQQLNQETGDTDPVDDEGSDESNNDEANGRSER